MPVKYYAIIDGEQKGPYMLEELPAAGVRPSTYIWCKGLPDWQKAEDNAEVCRLFRNHLYDLMHPSPENSGENTSEAADDRWKVKPDAPYDPHRSRFDGLLRQAGEDPLPSLEDIESKQNTSLPPVSMVGYAWLVTIFCFLPTGIVALYYSYKSNGLWKKGEEKLSHEYNRKAKMWTGITLFIGIIAYGALMALSL